MRRVTLIFTRHEEYGNCNSSQLFKIIEKIRPDVIFEELSQINFERSYYSDTLITLETNAIKQYLAFNNITHIPVDTFPRTKEYDESIDQLYSRLAGGTTQEAFQLRQLIPQHSEQARKYGFNFLNSSANDEYFNKLESLKLEILKYLNNEKLDKLFELEMKMTNDREIQILKNIYAFSRGNLYNEGLMLIGAGHRRSILPLIKRFGEQEEIKLIWEFY